MRILMMTNTYAPIVGGLEKSIQVFSEQLRLKGHEVKIVAPEFIKMPRNEKDIIRIASIEKFVGTDFSLSSPLPGKIQELIENFKPDIVHSHHPFLMGDLALRVCGQNKIPLVFTYHTMFEQYTNYFGLDNQAMQKFVVQIATGYAKMADQVIVPSESIERLLRERKITTPIAVVPTGLDVAYFAPSTTSFRKRFKILKNAFVVGHVGRLSPEKNLMFLTESVAEFLTQNKQAHFLIVGSGPSEREMKKMMRDKEVLERTHFAGVQKGKDLVQAYHAMDVFAFASKSETQGMVLTEAMAAGLPVVALDAPGVREVVIDKKNGRLLTEESVKKFSLALAWCQERSPPQWNLIKKHALETAGEFSREVCAAKALKVYERVLAQVVPSEEKWGTWQSFVGRFETELELFLNLGKATGLAMMQATIMERSVGEKISRAYQNKIKEALKTWTILLKKNRKGAEGPSDGKGIRPENGDEAMVQKIHDYEARLTELGRKIDQACADFEKCMNDASTDINKEFKISPVKK